MLEWTVAREEQDRGAVRQSSSQPSATTLARAARAVALHDRLAHESYLR
jgi:hypothetical protein